MSKSIDKEKIVKGEQGYIDKTKKHQLIRSIVAFSVAAGVFVLGLCLNKFEKTNIFTIIAVLLVLPAAKILVRYILLFPYHSVNREQFERVSATVKTGNKFYTEMVITSTQKAMNLAYMVVTGDKILAMAGREKENEKEIQEYISSSVRRCGFDYKVTVVKDEKQYIGLLSKSDAAGDRLYESEDEKSRVEAERERLFAFLESLMV